MTSKKYWIDPPYGWKYGFPKVYDPEKDGDDVIAWLRENDYPEDAEYYRAWEVKEDEQ